MNKPREGDTLTLSTYIEFSVDGIPPSVNHYVKHTRSGVHYTTDAAEVFQTKLALALRSLKVRQCVGNRFRVELLIRLGYKQKGDVDNFPKVVLDSLARLDVFVNPKGKVLSDSHVTELVVMKQRSTEAETIIRVDGFM